MSSHRSFQAVLTAVATVLVVLLVVPSSRAQLALELSMDDVIGYPDGQDIGVNVYLNNYTDTIAGFRLWFQVDKPNMAHFQAGLDTAGTLISGWDIASTMYETSDSTDLLCVGLAEYEEPYLTRGIHPQTDSLPLFRFRMRVEGNPDPYAEPVITIMINPFIDLFEFVDPEGNQIGRKWQEHIDTSYYFCVAWAPPDSAACLSWEKVLPTAPWDRMSVDTSQVLAIDYDKVALHDGSMAIVPGVCGDVDGSFDREVDISDVQRMIDHLFLSLEELPSPMMGNADGSTDFTIDISDLQFMISHLFLTMEPIDCGI